MTMKLTLFPILLLFLVGCQQVKPRTNADYVHEHHCARTSRMDTPGKVLVINGDPTYVKGDGFWAYNCPDSDLRVIIDDGEEQP